MKGPQEVVIVSGLSGSGKSTAIRSLEDIGYYCIDNLPAVLIQPFLDLCTAARENISRVALGVDLRERQFFAEYPRVLDELGKAGYQLNIVFLDAADDVLIRRFSETRRPHPLAGEAGPREGVRRERAMLTDLRARAERIVDTSGMTVHQLRDELHRFYCQPGEGGTLSVMLISFGYKFGVPTDADIVLDARFLANPFFVEDLRARSGCDQAVADFVLGKDEAREFLGRIDDLLRFTLPLYRREGKSYLTVAIGCTGGRHRSVALVAELAVQLEAAGEAVRVRHRDLRR